MKLTSTLSLLMLVGAVAAHADLDTRPFDLVRHGNQICKSSTSVFTSGAPEVCFKSLEDKDTFGFAVPQAVEVMDKVQAMQALEAQGNANNIDLKQLETVGGAYFLSPANRADLVKNYRRISIRNLAVDTEHIRTAGDEAVIPFLASIRWISNHAAILQGTINVQGELRINTKDLGTAVKSICTGSNCKDQNLSADLNKALSQLYVVNSVSDSSTASHLAPLHYLEYGARAIHFKAVYGWGSDVNADTASLMTAAVGPFLLGDVVYVPMLGAILNGINNLFNSVFGSAPVQQNVN